MDPESRIGMTRQRLDGDHVTYEQSCIESAGMICFFNTAREASLPGSWARNYLGAAFAKCPLQALAHNRWLTPRSLQ